MNKIIFILLLTLLVSCNGIDKKSRNNSQLKESNSQSTESVDYNAFYNSALNGQIAPVDNLINQGADVNHINQEGRTALMLASFNGHFDIVNLLINKGANINLVDNLGRSALMFASTGPFKETVDILIKKGADINKTDNEEKFTALMFAASEGQADIVSLLINAGADANMKDIDGETALDFARANGHNNVVDLLKK